MELPTYCHVHVPFRSIRVANQVLSSGIKFWLAAALSYQVLSTVVRVLARLADQVLSTVLLLTTFIGIPGNSAAYCVPRHGIDGSKI